jgi:hypothetical protein
MSRWISLITTAAVVMTSAAWAGDIFTPVLLAGSNAVASLECEVLNTGTATIDDVTISLHLGGNGVTVMSNTVSIPGGAERALVDSSPPGSGDFYCRVSGISKSKARVSLCAREASGTCKVIVTVP